MLPVVSVAACLSLLAGCGGGGDTAAPAPDPTTALTSPPAPSLSASASASPSGPARASDPGGTAATVPGGAGALAATVEELLATNSAPGTTTSASPGSPGSPDAAGALEGGDVSWPQCPKGMGIPERPTQGSPMPLGTARFVVIGLTNGPGFTANPCVGDQVAWARQRHLAVSAYSVISWPSKAQRAEHGGHGPFDAATESGRLANAGYAQGRFNLATLAAADLATPAIWLDVEPVPDFDWPSGGASVLARNAAVVRGAARAYTEAGFAVGVYSTTALWKRAVGGLRMGLREWRAAGHTSRAEAVRRCGPERSIQGGTAVIAQWVEQGRDRNVTCPGESGSLPLWFHQY